MFALTFLGHQGWLVETATTNLLIDPLLGDRMGHGGLLGEIYPPRKLELAALENLLRGESLEGNFLSVEEAAGGETTCIPARGNDHRQRQNRRQSQNGFAADHATPKQRSTPPCSELLEAL